MDSRLRTSGVTKLKADIDTREIAQSLTRKHALAAVLGIQSTPTFVIGGVGCGEVREFNRPTPSDELVLVIVAGIFLVFWNISDSIILK